MSTITPEAGIEPQQAKDCAMILAELATAPDDISVLTAAADVLPALSDRVRRLTAAPGTEDDDLLEVARVAGVLIERTA
ncbi:hypothetical protein [Streptantibioticus ferralitis]|uniref:Uncharacterized protein n=1 Tax=Streptantibioticus ferralitis TaxID=236510 RepID=A0ABT5ZAS0_9ACTN|nr:hypothetical protein [Streptantibioticus ferralitis]MDF2260936.1 hypothetical protein [Streptantibioticus ferralitis]